MGPPRGRRRHCLAAAVLGAAGAGAAWGFSPAPPPTFVSPLPVFKPPAQLEVPRGPFAPFSDRQLSLLRRLAGPGHEGRSRREVIHGAGVTLIALGLLRRLPAAVAASSTPTVGAEAEEAAGPGRTLVFPGVVTKSPADPNHYRAVTLPNGLRVLLVSDPDAERSAAAMDVHVGHYSDPDDIPGLAHFCEHMLFLGTEKFPDEAEYSQFLSSHGGGSNAYTDTEDTVYFFDVDSASLKGALDRFAEFFKAPLFTQSATSRELNAIESENAKNLQSDGFRFYQLQKSRANPAHPYSKFGTGNKETLEAVPVARGIDVREALISFHNKYYIAPRMTLALVGKEPLDTLQKWAEGLFSQVPTRPWSLAELEPWRGSPVLLPSAYGKQYSIVPVQELRQINLAWVVPFESEVARRASLADKPEYYVSHLVGHEGEGSLLSYLRRRGLANGLGSGYSSESGDFAVFDIAVDLTQAGERDLKAVQRAVFSYLRLLREGGVPDYVFSECSTLTSIAWRFQERTDSVSLASSVVKNMHDFDEASYLSGPRLLKDPPNKAAVKAFIDQLEPTKALVTVMSKSLAGKTNKKERWYNTPYQVSDVSSTLASLAKAPLLPDLRIHAPNSFLPTDLSLRASVLPRPAIGEPVPGPSCIRNSTEWSVFHKLDRTFGKPKTYAIFQVSNPVFGSSARNVALSKLFKVAFDDSLSEFAYPAALAGLSWEVDFTARGLRLVFGGYSDKLPAFAAEVSKRLKDFRPEDPQAFSRYKDLVRREFANFDKAQPYQHASYLASLSFELPKYPLPALRKELESFKLSDIQAFTPRLLERGHGTALIQGNVLESEALALADAIGRALPFAEVLPPEQRTKRRIATLPLTPKSSLGQLLRRREFNPDNSNAATELVFQIGSKDIKDRVTGELMAQLVEQPFYDSLRTQQQLGYLVFSGLRLQEAVPSFNLIVQSNVAGPALLAERMVEFVDRMGDLLAEISDKDFAAFVEGLVTRKLEREKRLEQEASRHWEEINLGTFNYDRPIEEARVLRQLKKADVVAFFDTYVRRGGAARRLLSVQMFPAQQAGGMKAVVADVEGLVEDELAFKAALPTYV